MVKGIIGKKVGMTQLFDESGKVIPVTVIEAGPCTVVQKKTVESDGYQAVQLGFGEVSAKKVPSLLSHCLQQAILLFLFSLTCLVWFQILPLPLRQCSPNRNQLQRTEPPVMNQPPQIWVQGLPPLPRGLRS